MEMVHFLRLGTADLKQLNGGVASHDGLIREWHASIWVKRGAIVNEQQLNPVFAFYMDIDASKANKVE